jgi:hypothetical protein
MGEDGAWTLMQSPFQKVPKQLAIHNVLCKQCWMAFDIESYTQVQWIGTAQSKPLSFAITSWVLWYLLYCLKGFAVD